MLGVILGAFGAHALKAILEPDQLSSFETGVRYQIYHGLAMLVLSWRNPSIRIALESWIQRLWFIGSLLFSGSIFLLTVGRSLDLNAGWAGPITPIGGTLLIVGWIMLCIGLLRLALQKNK